jgi:hypothetical protein
MLPLNDVNEERKEALYYSLLIIGGVIAFVLTLYGCLVSMMFDYRDPKELSLGLILILPFPFFLVSIRSLRWSATLLWIDFIALSAIRAFMLKLNPVDTLGILYFSPILILQLAILLASKRASSSL